MEEEKKVAEIPPSDGGNGKKKKDRKKTLQKVLLWVFASIVLLLTVLLTCRDLIVTAVIRKVVPQITGTQVVLGDFSSSLNGAIHVRDLQISNPAGFSQPHLFKITSIDVKIDIPSLFSKMPVIESVETRGLNINYELNSEGVSNVDVVQQNVEKFTGVKETPAEKREVAMQAETKTAEPEKTSSSASPLLRRLVLSGMSLQSGSVVVPLPDISLNDLGGSKPLGESLKEISGDLAETVRVTGGAIIKGVNAVGDSGKKLYNSGVDFGKKVIHIFTPKK